MTTAIDLKLDSDEEALRRLIAFPNATLLAYGGDLGTISCITNNEDSNGKKKGPRVHIVHQYDDGAVRAVAVSSDGKRVAVGYDNGSTSIYGYDDYNDASSHHPFAPPPKRDSDDDDDDDEDDNGFLSQTDRDDDDEDEDIGEQWAGPQMETAIRDLKFLSNSHWLAIASESTSGLCIVNVSSAETMKDRYLEIQVEKEHDGCGIRGMDITKDKVQLMASLALDGRLCIWKVGGLDSSKSVSDKVPHFREPQSCVPTTDIGECNGSSPSDRSCIPHWAKPDVLALPGKAELQLRQVTLVNDNLVVEESKKPANSDPSKGHIQPIAALTSQGDFIVSSGKDGRVILWELEETEDGLPAAQFVKTLGQYESIPTSLHWQNNTLYMACENGSMQIVRDFKPNAKTAAKNKGEVKRTTSKKAPEPSSKNANTKANSSKPMAKAPAKKSTPEASLEDSGDEETITKPPVKSKKPSGKKRPSITFADSDDEDDSEKENDNDITKAPVTKKQASVKQQANKEEENTLMEDSQDSEDDGPETQLPSVSSVLYTQDGDDEDSPPTKSASTKTLKPEQEPMDDSDDETNIKVSTGKSKPKPTDPLDDTDDEASTKSSSKKKSNPADDSDGEASIKEVPSKKKSKPKPTERMDDPDDEASNATPTKSPAKMKSKPKPTEPIMDDSDDEASSTIPAKLPAKNNSKPLLRELKDDSDDEASNTTPAKPPAKKESKLQLQELKDDSDDEDSNTTPAKSPAKKNESKLQLQQLQDDSDDEENISSPKTSEKADSKEEHTEASEHDKSSKKGNAKRLVKQSSSTQKDDDDDDIFDEVVEGEKTEKPAPRVSFIDDEAEDSKGLSEDEDDVMEAAPTQETTTASSAVEGNTATSGSQDQSGGVDNSGDHENDDGFPIHDDDEDSTADDIAATNEVYQTSHSSVRTLAGPALPEPQAAFAPSSTPLDLARRFLCWNSVGSITILSDEMGHRSTVDINFTDKAFRRPISFTDNMGFILGSLGDDGAIFATDLAHDDEDDLNYNEDDVMEGLSFSAQTKAALRKSQKQRMRKGSAGQQPLGSSIFFHRFETFASLRDKDFYITLPDGERVLGCACGQGWAAAVTSRKFLRLFTTGGNQGQILWLPGEPVTMVGRGRFLAVFYHASMPLQDGTQKLGYMLYDAVASRTVSKGTVCCITAGSSLSWAGFSNDCSLMAMDSDGMLSMLAATSLPLAGEDDLESPSTSWEWSPLLDTVGLRKSSEDSFWPITVFDGKLVCIPLKGATQYPDAARRPITATIGCKMPFARSTLAKSSALEELSVRSNLALTQKKVNNDISGGEMQGDNFEEEYRTMCAQVDKVCLKLFATTVEAGKLERALDLVDRLHLEKSYDLAMKIAENHTKLVDFIEEAKENKFPPEDFDDEDDHEQDYEAENDRHDVNSSPQGSRLQSDSSRISPDSDRKYSKRPFGEAHQRNVRARAF